MLPRQKNKEKNEKSTVLTAVKLGVNSRNRFVLSAIPKEELGNELEKKALKFTFKGSSLILGWANYLIAYRDSEKSKSQIAAEIGSEVGVNAAVRLVNPTFSLAFFIFSYSGKLLDKWLDEDKRKLPEIKCNQRPDIIISNFFRYLEYYHGRAVAATMKAPSYTIQFCSKIMAEAVCKLMENPFNLVNFVPAPFGMYLNAQNQNQENLLTMQPEKVEESNPPQSLEISLTEHELDFCKSWDLNINSERLSQAEKIYLKLKIKSAVNNFKNIEEKEKNSFTQLEFDSINAAFGAIESVGIISKSQKVVKAAKACKSVVSIIENIGKISGTMGFATISGLAALGPISGIVVAGVGMASLFMDEQPDEVQITLSELQTQVNELQEDIQQNFQQVYQNQKLLYNSITEFYNFVSIDFKIPVIIRLERIEQKIGSYFQQINRKLDASISESIQIHLDEVKLISNVFKREGYSRELALRAEKVSITLMRWIISESIKPHFIGFTTNEILECPEIKNPADALNNIGYLATRTKNIAPQIFPDHINVDKLMNLSLWESLVFSYLKCTSIIPGYNPENDFIKINAMAENMSSFVSFLQTNARSLYDLINNQYENTLNDIYELSKNRYINYFRDPENYHLEEKTVSINQIFKPGTADCDALEILIKQTEDIHRLLISLGFLIGIKYDLNIKTRNEILDLKFDYKNESLTLKSLNKISDISKSLLKKTYFIATEDFSSSILKNAQKIYDKNFTTVYMLKDYKGFPKFYCSRKNNNYVDEDFSYHPIRIRNVFVYGSEQVETKQHFNYDSFFSTKLGINDTSFSVAQTGKRIEITKINSSGRELIYEPLLSLSDNEQVTGFELMPEGNFNKLFLIIRLNEKAYTLRKDYVEFIDNEGYDDYHVFDYVLEEKTSFKYKVISLFPVLPLYHRELKVSEYSSPCSNLIPSSQTNFLQNEKKMITICGISYSSESGYFHKGEAYNEYSKRFSYHCHNIQFDITNNIWLKKSSLVCQKDSSYREDCRNPKLKDYFDYLYFNKNSEFKDPMPTTQHTSMFYNSEKNKVGLLINLSNGSVAIFYFNENQKVSDYILQSIKNIKPSSICKLIGKAYFKNGNLNFLMSVEEEKGKAEVSLYESGSNMIYKKSSSFNLQSTNSSKLWFRATDGFVNGVNTHIVAAKQTHGSKLYIQYYDKQCDKWIKLASIENRHWPEKTFSGIFSILSGIKDGNSYVYLFNAQKSGLKLHKLDLFPSCIPQTANTQKILEVPNHTQLMMISLIHSRLSAIKSQISLFRPLQISRQISRHDDLERENEELKKEIRDIKNLILTLVSNARQEDCSSPDKKEFKMK